TEHLPELACCGFCDELLAERERVRRVRVATIHGASPVDVFLDRCNECDADTTARPKRKALADAIDHASSAPAIPVAAEVRAERTKARKQRVTPQAHAGCFRDKSTGRIF
ncbi:MAG: hypothetical protein Q8S13_14025, partial [Dehalococcoidia bacterium]|nr:hypothetical protein [Dehalococcoidia bacterium]